MQSSIVYLSIIIIVLTTLMPHYLLLLFKDFWFCFPRLQALSKLREYHGGRAEHILGVEMGWTGAFDPVEYGQDRNGHFVEYNAV